MGSVSYLNPKDSMASLSHDQYNPSCSLTIFSSIYFFLGPKQLLSRMCESQNYRHNFNGANGASHCAKSWKVAGSIPDGVTEIFL